MIPWSFFLSFLNLALCLFLPCNLHLAFLSLPGKSKNVFSAVQLLPNWHQNQQKCFNVSFQPNIPSDILYFVESYFTVEHIYWRLGTHLYSHIVPQSSQLIYVLAKLKSADWVKQPRLPWTVRQLHPMQADTLNPANEKLEINGSILEEAWSYLPVE